MSKPKDLDEVFPHNGPPQISNAKWCAIRNAGVAFGREVQQHAEPGNVDAALKAAVEAVYTACGGRDKK